MKTDNDKKSKVLIVEDERLNIELYKEMLADGYELVIAENGKNFLEIIENSQPDNAPDIVLLDVMLPDFNGIDLCKIFKSKKMLVHIPIIMITTLNSPGDKIKALEAGANDYLNKPVDQTELLLKIQNNLVILEQYKKIKKQNHEINKYVEVIVHDLKNPLTVIMGYIDMLGDFAFAGDLLAKRYISQVNRTSRRMLDSINDILDVQKIQRTIFNIKWETFNLAGEIEEISSEWQVLAGKKRIRICLPLHTDVLHAVGDRQKCKDIINNLLSNAVKYSPYDTTVQILTENLPNGFVKVIVKDQGLGLTEEDKKKVFVEYQRLSAKPTGSETSTGLGLSIVRRLVELMGGTMGAESQGKNMGSSFWFTLPGGAGFPGWQIHGDAAQ